MSVDHLRHVLMVAIAIVVSSTNSRAQESYPVTTEHAIEATMRDGTILRADVYRPKTEDKFPVLLERTPYDKRQSAGFGLKAAARGYVVVVQDVRGRYTSDGEYPVKLDLYASSSAVDTDFTAKLVDVAPDGFAQNLTEGIVRARYRDSQEQPTFLNPGQTYKLGIDVWATSNVFRKGHRLRLELSSSNFPRFDRNLNTGEDSATARKPVSATNTIYHDAEHPSALVLPVVRTQ